MAPKFWGRHKIWIRRTAIKWALRRPAPNQIPMSGDAAFARNYFSVFLGDSRDSRRFIAQKAANHSLNGLWFNGDSEPPSDATISSSKLGDFQISIVHYANELVIEFHSTLEFLLHQTLGFDWIKVRRERFLRRWFNRGLLIRAQRISVLSQIVEDTFKDYECTTSSARLMMTLHGRRSFGHPKCKELLHYYDILLDSLVETGDLKNSNGKYRLGARALSTLAQYEQEERIHKDEMARQTALAWLTFFLVITGILQTVDKLPKIDLVLSWCSK